MFHKTKQRIFAFCLSQNVFKRLNTNKNNQKEFESEMKKQQSSTNSMTFITR